jgi:hypothetical protein
MKKIITKIRNYLDLYHKKPKEYESSMFALMPNGTMQAGSLSLLIYEKLKESYEAKYNDAKDELDVFIGMQSNFDNECHAAWKSFLAEINFDE